MHNRLVTPSNILTLARIALTPFLGYALFHAHWLYALQLFVLAGITDFFDGYLARAYRMHTTLGSYLDPIADKFLVTTSCIALALQPASGIALPGWFVCLVLFREAVILIGAIGMKLKDRSFSLTPTFAGKCAVAGYGVLIGCVVLSRIVDLALYRTAFMYLLLGVTSVALLSFGQYAYRVLKSVI